MWGAVIGDIAGSIYEYGQIKTVKQINATEIIPPNGFFSDDTILTIAILDAIENDKNYEKYLREYGKKYIDYKPEFIPYFKSSFSPGFIKWINSDNEGKSTGNGAMMRISPVGYMFNSEQEVIKNVRLATIPSHDSKEAIDCSEILALIIYYSRQKMNKEQIINKMNLKLKYKPFEKFNSTCYETIDNCLFALFSANSFEESIKNVLSYGGDTDTNACIVGSMAEAMYGINPDLIEKAKKKIPKEFTQVLERAYQNKKYDLEDFER